MDQQIITYNNTKQTVQNRHAEIRRDGFTIHDAMTKARAQYDPVTSIIEVRRSVSDSGLKLLANKAYWENKGKKWSEWLEKIVDGRLNGNSSWVFSAIRRTTKYDQF